MTFHNIAKTIEKFAADNSPSILTAVGVAGTITTAYLSAKAALNARDVLIMDQRLRDMSEVVIDEPDVKKILKMTWKCYIPPVLSGAATITAIVFANHIGSKRTVAMTAAYTISEKAYTEYKDKVVEKIGENKERAIRDEIAQDRITRQPVSSSEVLIAGNGEVMCFDAYTGRYFKCDVETIKKAQNDTNYQVLHDGYASLNDFYIRVGLPGTSSGEEVGWCSDKLLEVMFSTCMSDDQRPCISLEFRVAPVRDFHRMI